MIPRWSPFQIALILSFSLHLAVFSGLAPFSFRKKNLFSDRHDYHLPVEVELLSTGSPPDKILSRPAHSVEKKIVSHADLKKNRVVPVERSRLAQTTLKPPKSVTSAARPQFISKAESKTSSEKAWNQPPIYPPLAQRLGQEGRVIVDAQLDDSGKIISVKIARSSKFPSLDQAALDAVSQWKMDVPGAGKRRLFIPVTFQLKKSS